MSHNPQSRENTRFSLCGWTVLFLLLFCVISYASAINDTSPVNPSSDGPAKVLYTYKFSTMKYTNATLLQRARLFSKEPVFTIQHYPYLPESRNLLGHIDYLPSERNQGESGNCWVWSGTAALEAENDIQNGIKQRLSIQYFDSMYGFDTSFGAGTQINKAGGPYLLAQFYNTTKIAIPWSNRNANYQDGAGGSKAHVAAADIQTSPHYGIKQVSTETIQTSGVDQSTAIQHIKAALNSEKPVLLGFTIPAKQTVKEFKDFWANKTEDESFTMDMSTWAGLSGGDMWGHSVLCVGYEGNDWICLNSWPIGQYSVSDTKTLFINRPHNLFRLNMDLNYSQCYIVPGGSEVPGVPPLRDYYLHWEVLNVTFDEKTPIRPSLALDMNGAPHIAYFNESGSLMYASLINGTLHWNITTVYNSGYNRNRACSLAFDQDGIPHISSADNGYHNYRLRYSSPTGTAGNTWTTEDVAVSDDWIGDNSLVISNYIPQISYYDYSTRSLNYAIRDTEWQTGTLDATGDVGGTNSIRATTGASLPAISYTDYSRGALRYAQCTQSPPIVNGLPVHWQAQTVAGATGDIFNPVSSHMGKYTSLAIDANDQPYISFYGEGSAVQRLALASRSGNTWSSMLLNKHAGEVQGEFSSIALASDGSPRISTYERTNGDLVYLSPGPNSFLTTEVVDSVGNVGQHTSLALSPENVPYCAYYDATNRMVKCAWKDPSGWVLTKVGDVPVVRSISPESGIMGKSVYISILGGNFWSLNGTPPKVLLNRSGQKEIVARSVYCIPPLQLVAVFTLPFGQEFAGAWNVVVINPDDQSSLNPGTVPPVFTIIVPPGPPEITYIQPDTGKSGSNVQISILRGRNFTPGYETTSVQLVRKGQKSIDATQENVFKTDAITCIIPIPSNAAFGPWDVVVTSPNGLSGKLRNGFTIISSYPPPAVRAIKPDTGFSSNLMGRPPLRVTVSGSGFRQGARVFLAHGGDPPINATNIVIQSGTSLACNLSLVRVPRGVYDVAVVNDDTQKGVLPNGFTVLR